MAPVLAHWGHRKVVISLQEHKKRTTLRKRRQTPKLNPKKVTAWAGAISAVLLVVKLLVEITRLIFPN